jgi:hypothetical protein
VMGSLRDLAARLRALDETADAAAAVAVVVAERVAEVPPPPAAPPAAPVCPAGNLYLSGLAVRLDVALRDGAAVVRCPSGALDLTLPDGRLWLLSPDTVARLAAARLLPPGPP